MTVIEADGILHQPLVRDEVEIYAAQRYSVIVSAHPIRSSDENVLTRSIGPDRRQSAGRKLLDLRELPCDHLGCSLADLV
jgi:FtsP/CotA-like multicopper oxidase with cupredoxin domain